jgi:hypothetical protein
MRIDYQRRLVYFGCILLLAMYVSAVALLLISSAGSAIGSRFNTSFASEHKLRDYKPWDNSSADGPNYLVGPPGHSLRDGARNEPSPLLDNVAKQSRDEASIGTLPLPAIP